MAKFSDVWALKLQNGGWGHNDQGDKEIGWRQDKNNLNDHTTENKRPNSDNQFM